MTGRRWIPPADQSDDSTALILPVPAHGVAQAIACEAGIAKPAAGASPPAIGPSTVVDHSDTRGSEEPRVKTDTDEAPGAGKPDGTKSCGAAVLARGARTMESIGVGTDSALSRDVQVHRGLSVPLPPPGLDALQVSEAVAATAVTAVEEKGIAEVEAEARGMVARVSNIVGQLHVANRFEAREGGGYSGASSSARCVPFVLCRVARWSQCTLASRLVRVVS